MLVHVWGGGGRQLSVFRLWAGSIRGMFGGVIPMASCLRPQTVPRGQPGRCGLGALRFGGNRCRERNPRSGADAFAR